MSKLAHDETGLDEVDPKTTTSHDAKHFRAIRGAQEGVDRAEDELREAVGDARCAGESWSMIGAALGTTRQAAFQRFGSRR